MNNQTNITLGIETYNYGSAIFQIKSSETVLEPVDSPIKIAEVSDRGVAPWGKDNDLPQQILEVVGANPVGMSSIEHKIDIAFGSGVKIGKHVYNEKTKKNDFVEFGEEDFVRNKSLQEVKNFIEENDFDEQLGEIISDLIWFSNGFAEFILNRDDSNKRKITRVTSKEATYSRLEVANEKTGKIENHFYFGNWPDTPKKEDVTKTPVIFNSRDLEEQMGRRENSLGKVADKRKFKYVIPLRLPSPGKLYYPYPYFYSIIKSGWLDFGNAIPRYKKAYMQNMMSIKYIVKIREDYFPKIFSKENITEPEKQKERKRKELDAINQYLRGVDAAGKSMITYFKTTPDGKEMIPEIEVKVLDQKQGGEFIEDAHEASAMTFIAFRTHPSLIGVIPGKTTSNLSGSDKRELLRIAQTLQIRIRKVALKPLYIIKKINNWPEEVEFTINDIILTTLDQGKETQTVSNS